MPQRVYISGHIFEPLTPIRFAEHGQYGISLRNAFVEDFSGMTDGLTHPALRATESPRIACRIEVCDSRNTLSNILTLPSVAGLPWLVLEYERG